MENIDNDLVFEEPLEEEDVVIENDGVKRKIFTSQSDPEVISLYDKSKRGRLIVQPDFQRQYVWDTRRASKLIESALIDIPLPVIYLAEEEDGKVYVIDGQQRLTSFFSFIDGYFPDGRKFKLKNMQVFPELNNKLFSEIDESYQDKIRDCEIRAITFRKESDPELRFEIFERLNTGAVSLNDQELRNCIYRGTYNKLLKELSEDDDFKYLLGIKEPDKRMRDIELVLRFAAFYHQSYLNYKPPIRTFLNNEMDRYKDIGKKDADDLRKAFKNAVLITRSLLDKNAFKRFISGDDKNPNGYWEPKKFNVSLYDITMSLFAREDINIVFRNLDSIKEGYVNLLASDQEFKNAVMRATSNQSEVIVRFDKMRLMLQSILGVGNKEPRCFTLELKRELFKENPTCKICGQNIQSIDDAAVDHIEQYWTGGATIPTNARLTHRFCNWSRPRKD